MKELESEMSPVLEYCNAVFITNAADKKRAIEIADKKKVFLLEGMGLKFLLITLIQKKL